MNDKPQPFASFEERQAKMGFPPYNSDIADLAWSRLFNFLEKHLRYASYGGTHLLGALCLALLLSFIPVVSEL